MKTSCSDISSSLAKSTQVLRSDRSGSVVLSENLKVVHSLTSKRVGKPFFALEEDRSIIVLGLDCLTSNTNNVLTQLSVPSSGS
jgi:hypothetical protein